MTCVRPKEKGRRSVPRKNNSFSLSLADRRFLFGRGSRFLGKDELITFDRDVDSAVMELVPQDFLRERVLQVAFNRPTHWTRSVNRVESLLDEKVLRFGIEFQIQIPILEALGDFLNFQIEDFDEVDFGQRVHGSQ